MRFHFDIKKFFVYFFLIVGALIMIFPFYWMIVNSLKTAQDMTAYPPTWVPSNWFNFDNYIEAFNKAPFGIYFINSVIVTISCVIITTFTTILGAFAFSRLKFKGRDLIFSLMLGLMMVPFEMLVITNYTTVAKLGLIDTLAVLILPFTSSIFYTYILRNFFLSIPDSLYYSARIDGASNWKYLWRIMVPIAKPSLMTITLLNAITCWNSFFWTLLVINNDVNRTLPYGLYAFMTEGGSDTKLMMAAATFTVLPMIILFLFARKYIVNGVARGGLKG